MGGLFAAKFTLRRSFFFMAVALNIPHVTYYYLSHALPGNMALVSAIVTIEKFGFGFGSIGHMLYMMQQIAPGPFKMSHYAFATGVMALTKMSTGWISGPIYNFFHHNYPQFLPLRPAGLDPPDHPRLVRAVSAVDGFRRRTRRGRRPLSPAFLSST